MGLRVEKRGRPRMRWPEFTKRAIWKLYFFWILVRVPSSELTYPLFEGTFERLVFLFPFGGICIRSLEGTDTSKKWFIPYSLRDWRAGEAKCFPNFSVNVVASIVGKRKMRNFSVAVFPFFQIQKRDAKKKSVECYQVDSSWFLLNRFEKQENNMFLASQSLLWYRR